jgi:CBS domain-containing protein
VPEPIDDRERTTHRRGGFQEDSMSSGPFHDRIDDRYRSTLRYLATEAYADPDGPDESDPAPPRSMAPTGAAFVGDVMVTGVVAAHEGAVFKEIVDALVRNHISAVPVIDSRRRVIGIVSEADLLARVCGRVTHPRGHRLTAHREQRAKMHAETARELMTSPPVVTTPHATIEEAARICARARVRRLPVVDPHGVLVGIVTRGTLLQPFLRPDDEICEDIQKNVITSAFVMNPFDLDVHVTDGIVTLRGQVERRLLLDSLVAAVRNVAGVIDVDDSLLTYRFDDTHVPPLVPGL